MISLSDDEHLRFIGTSENLASVRLVWTFSPIKAIFRRNASAFQGKLTKSGGKRRAKMMGARFSEVPLHHGTEQPMRLQSNSKCSSIFCKPGLRSIQVRYVMLISEFMTYMESTEKEE